ncbi:MAG: hypothetical protein KME46_19600 [Brasilonema angustatum HA4187-MV1]|nr:hypothetical protein [Brasilonema angustatum HA4187-MV1]
MIVITEKITDNSQSQSKNDFGYYLVVWLMAVMVTIHSEVRSGSKDIDDLTPNSSKKFAYIVVTSIVCVV